MTAHRVDSSSRQFRPKDHSDIRIVCDHHEFQRVMSSPETLVVGIAGRVIQRKEHGREVVYAVHFGRDGNNFNRNDFLPDKNEKDPYAATIFAAITALKILQVQTELHNGLKIIVIKTEDDEFVWDAGKDIIEGDGTGDFNCRRNIVPVAHLWVKLDGLIRYFEKRGVEILF